MLGLLSVAPELNAILERGRGDGSVCADVDIADIVHAVIRYSRPVELPVPIIEERAMAHRHLDRFVDGLGRLP